MNVSRSGIQSLVQRHFPSHTLLGCALFRFRVSRLTLHVIKKYAKLAENIYKLIDPFIKHPAVNFIGCGN